jgi:phosphatidylglycerol:prolipoprotein diacylglycerol transferase
VYIGTIVSMRTAKRWELHAEAFSTFLFWILVWGFVAGHVLDEIFYHPEQVLRDPLSLIKIWAGLSSFGGFIGGALGAIAFKVRFRIKHILPFVDVMAAVFPLGWVFGRMGCSVVHDHPGAPSNLWFAVRYPGGGRFDLGLYEMLFAVLVMIATLWLARKPRPPGFFVGITMLAYAPVRFALDFLRASVADRGVAETDPRYLQLTPAQWACFLMAAGAVYLLVRACNSSEAGTDPFRNALEGVDPAVFLNKRAAPEAKA